MLAWAALLIVAGAGARWFQLARAVRLPANRSGFVALWLVGAGLAIAAFAQGVGWLSGAAAGLAILGSAFFCLTIGVSAQKAPDAIAVGAAMPAFSAPDESGALVDSARFAGKPLLLKFFRGHW